MKKLYTPREVAEILRVSLKFVEKHIALGNIKRMKLGPKLNRISEEELTRLLEEGF